MYRIGTKYKPVGKNYVCTVTDILTTTNLAGEVVAVRYVAEHEFCGQVIIERDVLPTTIARGLQ